MTDQIAERMLKIVVKLPRDLVDMIDQGCRDVPRDDVIRRAVEEWLSNRCPFDNVFGTGIEALFRTQDISTVPRRRGGRP